MAKNVVQVSVFKRTHPINIQSKVVSYESTYFHHEKMPWFDLYGKYVPYHIIHMKASFDGKVFFVGHTFLY